MYRVPLAIWSNMAERFRFQSVSSSTFRIKASGHDLLQTPEQTIFRNTWVFLRLCSCTSHLEPTAGIAVTLGTNGTIGRRIITFALFYSLITEFTLHAVHLLVIALKTMLHVYYSYSKRYATTSEIWVIISILPSDFGISRTYLFIFLWERGFSILEKTVGVQPSRSNRCLIS